jgi:tetratricopeptide (TPR) repeat protein
MSERQSMHANLPDTGHSIDQVFVKRSMLAWVFFGALVLFLLTRIFNVNIGYFLAEQKDPAALDWHPAISGLLYQQAIKQDQSSPAQARQTAIEALRSNPIDGRIFLLLAIIAEQSENKALADAIVASTEFLHPRRPEHQLQVGYFWARQGRIAKAMEHWSVALQMKPELGKELYPLFLTIAESSTYRTLFTQMQAPLPNWTEVFFKYAIQNAISLETVSALYLPYERQQQTPPESVRKAYLNRLMAEGLWTDAYFVWLNTLAGAQLNSLGNINNGGFEQEFAQDGFAWQFTASRNFIVNAQPTYGMTGTKALRVEFLGTAPATTRLAIQNLLLDPGEYQFTGKYRIDGLATVTGFKWRLSCWNGALLAETPYMVGSIPWTTFRLPLVVPPAECVSQRLELVMAPADARIAGLSGTLWFDDLALAVIR